MRKVAPPSMKREQMVAALIAEHGITCLGCGRTFDSARIVPPVIRSATHSFTHLGTS